MAPTPSLLSEVLRADGGVTPAAAPGAAPAVSAGDSLVERLRALGPQDRRARLRRVIAAEVGRVLGLSAEQLDSLRPLSEQGVDSLMAVEIRNALARLLGRPLPVTMVFDFPTLDALASRLADELGAPAAVAPPAVAAAGAEDDPLVIVGLGCHLPGGVRTPEELWQLLCEGQVAVEEVPPQRWDVDAIFDADPAAPGKTPSRWMGWLRGVDEFDPLYFEISPREAVQMDPQQRQLLETVVRACESGGLTRQRLSAARAAVFVGISGNEYLARHVAAGHATILDMFSGTGNTASVAAGRISYLLDLGGPSLALDTACSSSLVALHLACESVRRGEAHLALAAGVNLLLAPETTIAMSKLGALSPTGRCRPFDRRADGYVRSEGCVVVAVERLSEARKHGDVVFAVVRATAVNQDGRSNGLTAPNGLAQQDVMRRALERSGLRPDQIGYVEAHGTGTPLGDPIELQALQEVYGTRGADRPLLVGSLKANLGHMEAAAGLGGLLKVVLALQHGQIPPQPDALQPNPYIDWDAAPVQVAGSLVAWPGGGEVRRGAVSSFGFSGTNAHVILESAPPPPAAASPSTTTPDRAWLLPISARSPAALADLLRGYDGWLTKMAPSQLGDLCLTAALRRDHHAHRLAVCGASPAALQAAIRGALALGVTVPEGWMQHGEPPVFLFSGQGSQWPEMGRRLLAQEPVFAAAFDACGEALSAHLPWDARAVIEGRAAQIDRERADVVQPLLFALQVAFAALWRSWGIAPAGVVGHSLGEVAAAHVAGALGLEDAAQVISVRSKLLAGLEGEGRMAIVHLEAADAEALVARSAGRLCIAAYNGARSLVLSGQPDALAALVAELSGRNVFARFVGTRMAAHSPQVEPLLDELRARLAGVAPRATTIPFFSSVTGEVADGRALGPEYWAQNLRQPVRFRHSLASAVALGHRTFVELSPHPILLPALQADQDLRAEELVLLASGERDADERHVMLSSLAELYRRGALPRFDVALMPGGLEEVSAPAAGAAAPPWRVASLPRYPFQRARYWLSTPTAQAQRDTASLRDTYQVVWSESPPARGRGGEGAAADAPTFVLHARDHGAAAPLVAALERQGGRCRVWTAEPTPPAGELDGRQVIVELGLVEPISALEAEARTGGQMLEAVGARLTQALQAAQALARGPRAAQRLYWITRGAQAVGGQPVTAVQDSPLWGLGRGLALEHPELLAALIDLDPSASVADCWTQLAEELWRREALSPAPTLGAGPDAASDGEPASPSLVEDQLAFRSGRRYRARLRRLEQTLPAEAAPLQADASYLILGGLSFLGGQLARWWSQRGARHLILTTRGSAADAMTSQELSRRDDLLRDLAAAGVTVTLRSWDGLDEAPLHALFDDAAAQGHPVRGVAHLAGASSVCALLDLGGDELRRVLAPKVAGAWALHRVTAGRSLDFFVLYSSAAGVWGAAGSGHYGCLLYTSPSPRDGLLSRMPSSA